jgi:hypothetical protein
MEWFSILIVWSVGFICGCIGLFRGISSGKIPNPVSGGQVIVQRIVDTSEQDPARYFANHRASLITYLSNQPLLVCEALPIMSPDRRVMIMDATIQSLPASHLNQVMAVYDDRMASLSGREIYDVVVTDILRGQRHEPPPSHTSLRHERPFRRVMDRLDRATEPPPVNPVAPSPTREPKRKINLD